MATTALEAIGHFIAARHMREGETFAFASLQIRYPNVGELRAALAKMGEDGMIENLPDGPYRLTKAGYMQFFGEPPSEDDAIKAIMAEIAMRGIKTGKSFLWMPLQEQLRSKHFGADDLKPALEKICDKHWLEAGSIPGFYRLTEAGFAALATFN
jgi:hypothetical protein